MFKGCKIVHVFFYSMWWNYFGANNFGIYDTNPLPADLAKYPQTLPPHDVVVEGEEDDPGVVHDAADDDHVIEVRARQPNESL